MWTLLKIHGDHQYLLQSTFERNVDRDGSKKAFAISVRTNSGDNIKSHSSAVHQSNAQHITGLNKFTILRGMSELLVPDNENEDVF